jgi:hypothetical protein
MTGSEKSRAQAHARPWARRDRRRLSRGSQARVGAGAPAPRSLVGWLGSGQERLRHRGPCPVPVPAKASQELQPGGICVYVGTSRAGSRRSGVGLAPGPQALPMPAAALILYVLVFRRRPSKCIVRPVVITAAPIPDTSSRDPWRTRSPARFVMSLLTMRFTYLARSLACTHSVTLAV